MDSGLDTLWRDTMRAVGFLTRLPVPPRYFEGDTGALTTTARAFPLAAIIATLPALGVLIIGTLFVLPPLLIAALAVATLTITCGGLHEDGLADVADGFFGGDSVTSVDKYPHRAGQTGTRSMTIPRNATGGPKEASGIGKDRAKASCDPE